MCRVPEEMPEEVAQLMNECLAYDPKERPSAKQIYDRLSTVQSSSEASAASAAGSKSESSGSTAAKHPAMGPGSTADGSAAGMPEKQAQDDGTYTDHYRELGGGEPPQKAPTPLGIKMLPIKSAFDMSE